MKPRERRQPLAFPLRVDNRGRTANSSFDQHVRDLIEQLLFTSPGERVNRPSFGTDLRHALFAPNSDELSAALEHTVRGALQRWLGEHIAVSAVDIAAEDATLRVDVRYQVKRKSETRTARFERKY